MSNRRWLKFWPQDWQREPSLRMVSLGARGLWMELLCIAHEGQPYGHVTVNGRAPTPRQIATMVGVTVRECEQLLAELETAGTFSRTEDGTIYSRRMLKDEDASEKGREAIAKRWGKSSKPINGSGSPPTSEPIRGADSLDTEARKKENTEASLRAADAAEPPDIRAELWQRGLPILRAMTGQTEARSRALLGQLVKAARDDCARVMAVLSEARDMRPVDPVAWLQRAVTVQRVSTDDQIRLLIDAQPEELPRWMLQ